VAVFHAGRLLATADGGSKQAAEAAAARAALRVLREGEAGPS
jgi:dsRNA-specific ribonuclease